MGTKAGGSAMRDRLRTDPSDGGEVLPGVDPDSTGGVKSRKAAESEFETLLAQLEELQSRLWAEGTRSLLVILQGMDTSGKDGTVKRVMGSMNPAGCDVAAFKQPTEEELAHHFLWRIRKRLPAPGEIVIFNRSHYEDVVAVRVNRLAPEDVWSARYEEINAFEEEISRTGTSVVKIFLHISYDEQRERLLERLREPDKRWKFSEGDIDARANWSEYQAAWEAAIERCSTDAAPWYVVAANHKWYRNWAISRLLVETLVGLDPRYPQPDLDIERLEARLRPPH